MFTRSHYLTATLLAGSAFLLVAAPLLGQGRGRGGGGTPASPAAEYRQDIMGGFQTFQSLVRAAVANEAGSPSHVASLAEGWKGLAMLLHDAFPAGSAGEGSRALPAIWEQPEEFTNRINALTGALDGLIAAARSGDAAAVAAAADQISPNCGACHQPFRAAAGRGGGGR